MSQHLPPTVIHNNGLASTIMSIVASTVGLILILLISFVLMPTMAQQLNETSRVHDDVKNLRRDVEYLISVNKRLNAVMDANEARQKAAQDKKRKGK